MKIIALTILLLLVHSSAIAETSKAKYLKIQKEIELNKDKLRKAKKKETTIVDDIDKVEKELNKINKKIKRQKRELGTIKNKIQSVKSELISIDKALQGQRSSLKGKLRAMQKYGNMIDRLMIIVNSEDFFQLLRLNRYLTKISEHEYEKIIKYKDVLNALSKKEKELSDLQSDLKSKTAKFKSTEKTLHKKRKEKDYLLLSVKKKQMLYSAMLKDLNETSSKIKELIARDKRSVIFKGRNFYKMKGKLHWPVDGRLAIPYGTHKDPRFKTPVFRNGIYISTKKDENVKAVYQGKVVFAELFKGLGKVVIINHGEGYHTVYANLSKIVSKTGDVIKMSDILGKSGKSTTLNGKGIYFEVRYKGKPINPARWLVKQN